MKGFTLLEVMLSIAIIAILTGLSVLVYQGLQQRNELDVAVNNITGSLRRAQILSQAVDGDTTWGVKVQSGNIISFKGASFALRDTTYDESFDLPSNISIEGVSEIVYNKFTGLPQTAGNLTLTSEVSETKTIILNAKGMVDY